MARGSGVGSLPGVDFSEAAKVALGDADLPFLPELPARGVHAGMVGRTLGLITELGADLQPDGWRIGVGEGVDQRRARSLLAQDLDVVEELAHDYDGTFKTQVVGPFTLAANVEHPRGEKVVADHGARRELGEVLAIGLDAHLADLRRRLPRAELVVQVDEPSLPAVLAGAIRTASGFQRLRSVEPPEADQALRAITELASRHGAKAVVHSCARDVPVRLLQGAGFSAISFDLTHTTPDDEWSAAFDTGVDLWPGVVPSTEPSSASDNAGLAVKVNRFFSALGFGTQDVIERLVVTPTCGLAGATPRWARQALNASNEVARRIHDGTADGGSGE